MFIELKRGKFFVPNADVTVVDREYRGITKDNMVPISLYKLYGKNATLQDLDDDIEILETRIATKQARLTNIAAKFKAATDADLKEALELKLEDVANIKNELDMQLVELIHIRAEVTG